MELTVPGTLSVSASKSKTPSVVAIGLLPSTLLTLLGRFESAGRLKDVAVNEKSQESIVQWTTDVGRPRRS